MIAAVLEVSLKAMLAVTAAFESMSLCFGLRWRRRLARSLAHTFKLALLVPSVCLLIMQAADGESLLTLLPCVRFPRF